MANSVASALNSLVGDDDGDYLGLLIGADNINRSRQCKQYTSEYYCNLMNLIIILHLLCNQHNSTKDQDNEDVVSSPLYPKGTELVVTKCCCNALLSFEKVTEHVP